MTAKTHLMSRDCGHRSHSFVVFEVVDWCLLPGGGGAVIAVLARRVFVVWRCGAERPVCV